VLVTRETRSAGTHLVANGLTYEQSATDATIRTITHFLHLLKFRGFSGSSLPLHVTRNADLDELESRGSASAASCSFGTLMLIVRPRGWGSLRAIAPPSPVLKILVRW
jgi:hypothetical protein